LVVVVLGTILVTVLLLNILLADLLFLPGPVILLELTGGLLHLLLLPLIG
jgi:hypothetical protein